MTRRRILRSVAVVCLWLLVTAEPCRSDVVDLTMSNYDDLTSEKTVFINFCASWSLHCKKLAPIWEELAELWKDSNIGLIATVNCATKSTRPLCNAFHIRGFPTIKYGHPRDLKEYSGGRTLDDLQEFAKSSLVPTCTPQNSHLCDAESKKWIEEYMSLSKDELEALLVTEQRKMASAEAAFQHKMKELQEEYDWIERERDDAIKEIRDGKLGVMSTVYAAKLKLESRNEEKKSGGGGGDEL